MLMRSCLQPLGQVVAQLRPLSIVYLVRKLPSHMWWFSFV